MRHKLLRGGTLCLRQFTEPTGLYYNVRHDPKANYESGVLCRTGVPGQIVPNATELGGEASLAPMRRSSACKSIHAGMVCVWEGGSWTRVLLSSSESIPTTCRDFNEAGVEAHGPSSASDAKNCDSSLNYHCGSLPILGIGVVISRFTRNLISLLPLVPEA